MKNSTYSTLFSLILIVLLSSCGGGDNSSNDKLPKKKNGKTATEAVQVSSLPSISFEEMKKIYEGTDFIDIIFYNVDFSMSVNNKSNIQRMIGMISTNAAQVNPSCQAMGRLFFQKNGELLIEADMYYNKTCQYFVFQKNGKPAYANYITPEGQAYFAKIFSQVKVEPTEGTPVQ